MSDQLTDQRFIIEMGIGVDQYGQDRTKAACKAVTHAISFASLSLFANMGIDRDQVRLKITIGSDKPGEVNTSEVAKALPFGEPEIVINSGGLQVQDGGKTIIVANAAVEVFLPKQT